MHSNYLTTSGEIKTEMQVRLEYGHDKLGGYPWEIDEWLKSKKYSPATDDNEIALRTLLREAQGNIKKLELEISDLRSKFISEKSILLKRISERDSIIKSYNDFVDRTLSGMDELLNKD